MDAAYKLLFWRQTGPVRDQQRAFRSRDWVSSIDSEGSNNSMTSADKIKSLVDETIDKAEPLVDKILEKAESLTQEANDRADLLVEKVKEKAEPLLEKVKAKTEPLFEKDGDGSGKDSAS